MMRAAVNASAASAVAREVGYAPVRASRALGLSLAPSSLDRVLVGLLVVLLLASVVMAKRSSKDLDKRFPHLPTQEVARQVDIHLPSAKLPSERAVLASLISDIIGKVGGKLEDQERESLAVMIVDESLSAGYDPLFVAAVIKAESTFNNTATSHRGAQGLMQIMPTTGRYISERSQLTWLGAHQLHEPAYNIRLGIAYLKYLEDNFDFDREGMLIAYNWGPTNLSGALKRGSAVPSSSRRYARTILGTHEKWRRDFSTRMARVVDGAVSNVG